jgi:hypothetical protein
MLDQQTLSIRIDRTACGMVVRDVVPPAPLPVARLFLGQTPVEAARRAGMVFSVCGAAQAAAVRAAFGLVAEPDSASRLLHETLRDHALKLAIGWPQALGHEADPLALAAVARMGADRGAALGLRLFGASGAPTDLADFEYWLKTADTAPARVLAAVWQGWDDAWGAVDLPLWSPAMGAPDPAGAGWQGRPAETGLTAVHADHPLLRAIAARRGRGLVWRLAARLVDAAAALDALAHDLPPPLPRALEPGFGMAQAARGAMLVQGAIAGGVVTRLDRLSPTDAALHPDGLLARALDTLPTVPDAPLAAVAALLVEAVDPCLPCKLTVADKAPAKETPDVHCLRL